MDLALKNTSVLISGGASGIGEAIVRAFAAENAQVAFIDKDNQRGTDLAKDVANKGQTALFLHADLTVESDCEAAILEAIHANGPIQTLINNAGLNDGAGLTGTPDQFRTSLERNLIHYFTLAKACRQSLIDTRGAIINISSKAGTTGQGGNSGYAASKGAINSLTREWALELAPHGVRVNSIIPAEVQTPQYDSWLKSVDDPEATLKNITDLIPLQNRLTTPEEIADTALFLASKKSSHTTGQHIHIDGGYTHLDKANIARNDPST